MPSSLSQPQAIIWASACLPHAYRSGSFAFFAISPLGGSLFTPSGRHKRGGARAYVCGGRWAQSAPVGSDPAATEESGCGWVMATAMDAVLIGTRSGD